MANPPITIGPFSNVPAPGSPIKSDWCQQITQWVVDRPRGLLGVIYGGAATVSIEQDVTGTLTWVADPARYYRVVGSVNAVPQNVSTGFQTLSITDGAGGHSRDSVFVVPAGSYVSHYVEELITGFSGTTVRKLRFACSAGNASIPGGFTSRPQLYVHDLGKP